ncbi:thiamine biosynthesis protein ApbE [Janthinobacterium sp. BJB412]|nr:thiamine biosynthesis protein ApbE [Janthinobacterium sp. BJB412]
MGTRYSAVFYAPDEVDLAAINASLFAAVDKVDRQMSTWNPASDLCRLNAAPEDVWLAVPPELAQVLDAGLRVGRQSNGAFDMGLGQLVDDWGFGPAQRTPVPQLATLRHGAAGPTDEALEVDLARLQVRKRAPLALDLSAIAKGYGVDQLAHCLDGHAIDSYLVGIDGEMRARAAKPGGDAWAVAIEKPVFGSREVAGVMELHDMAIATSGDYRRWVDVAGVRYSHTMHPALRRPLSNRLAAVTVLAPTCMLADAWATALMVLGPVDGVALARETGMDALFVLRDGAGFQEILIGGDALRP